jgi:hypothetical protein
MSTALISARSGREAAIARRQALSAGKVALPPPSERVRTGERAAALPAPKSAPAPAPVQVQSTPAPQAAAPASSPLPAPAQSTLSGRLQAIERRRLLSGGKKVLLAATGKSPAPTHNPRAQGAAAPSAPAPAVATPPAAAPANANGTCDASCRDQARARRAAMSKFGRGKGEAAPPSRPPRQGTIDYAPKVTDSATQSGQRVTGLRIGNGNQVTGHDRGTGQPVSGSQYIGTETSAAFRPAGAKVGHSRTQGGVVVSGTLVRSQVSITGDEAGSRVPITGEADQRLEDDLTTRSGGGTYAMAQFQRQADPHGQSVFGSNLGRSARSAGSRDRQRSQAIESTESGQSITGSAVGRSQRVTGDETGACRGITGTQYLAPARMQAECGVAGAPVAARQAGGAQGGTRIDPVTGGKVAVAQSWNGQRITGVDVEYSKLVTGDAHGTCSTITGTQYQGPGSTYGWCDPSQAQKADSRLPRRPASSPVTGDIPMHDSSVTGTHRGAVRDISGTPYYCDDTAKAAPEATVAAIAERFSVPSPQRKAHLGSATTPGGRITGSFAMGQDKITGNTEFLFKSRQPADAPSNGTARNKITGEGRNGKHISGDSWADTSSVTGTEGSFASERNPSLRGPKAKPFAGASVFKSEASHEEPKQLVTGTFGFSSKSAAKVTLSGGGQG